MFYDQERDNLRFKVARDRDIDLWFQVDFRLWEEELRDGLSLDEQQLVDLYRWNLDTGGDAS